MKSPNTNGSLIHLAHVSLGLNMGGMEKLLVEFARHADRERFRLHFFSLEGRGKLADEVEELGWPVESMEKGPGVRPDTMARLAWRFRKLRIDVVHAHNTAACLYAVPAARLARVPVAVMTRHGQGPKGDTRHGRLLLLASRFVDSVVCVSHDSERHAEAVGISPKRLTTIWNGIDTERFSCRGRRSDGPAILVARLSPEKDIPTLLHAVALVLQRNPSFALTIVGDGPCRKSLEKLALELGISSHVAFLGEMDDVARRLQGASMFLLSSLSEGIPLTILEAMATGLPVVATRVGGIPEVVVDRQTGLLVPPGQPESLANAIAELSANRDFADSLGVNGRQRVETMFDVRAMVRSYEELYVDCLRRTRRGRRQAFR
jgi:glycosyltransferase involved in cell wall biosynthesis